MPDTQHAFLLAFLQSNRSWMVFWILWINLIAFLGFGMDKWRAVHRQRRIPERCLFRLAAEGGAMGALLWMCVFRYKNRCSSAFRFGIRALLLTQTALLFLVYVLVYVLVK